MDKPQLNNLVLKTRVLSPAQSQLPAQVLGSQGEQRALRYLNCLNYQILDHNVLIGRDELDLVAWDKVHHEVVFIEVKTRGSSLYGNPAAAVNFRKLKALRRAASRYLQARQLEKAFRFDIIAVLPTQIEHFENVTW